MNIHHKNMKQLSQHMQSWTQSNLEQHGIYECTFARFDKKEAEFLAIPMFYDWHFIYLEQDLDLQIYKRLIPGARYLENSCDIYKNYYQFIKNKCEGKPNYFKFDVITETQSGYEMVTVGSDVPLTPQTSILLKKLSHQLSYEVDKVIKSKTNIKSEFRAVQSLLEQESNTANYEVKDTYNFAKSKYNDIVLTVKEQQYIRHLMFNKTQKEIAYEHNCSETAVRKVILNIKRKLGYEYMANSAMFNLLEQKDVLFTISATFKASS
tara:strand:+ start:211 stop:1005 length:795 start_codon:yes stop_codon:yes gene_type:complete